MRRGIYVYPWDLQEEGTRAVAERLRAAAIDTVSVATAYHAGKFLRPHAPRRKVYFPEDGTVYFQPRAELYGRVKPVQSKLAQEFDVLSELAKEAADLAVSGWTVGLHNTRLGEAHPDLVCTTAYGDPLYNALCPAQPQVREYLISLCTDLGRGRGLREIALETPGYQAYRHGHHHEFELVELTEPVETLLGICFCPACRNRAKASGIDAEALSRLARSELDHFFESGRAPERDVRSDPEWSAFHDLRASVVTSLVAEIRAELDPSVSLAIIPSVQTPNDLCWREGSNLAELAETADRLEVPAYQCGEEAIAADMSRVRQAAGSTARIGFILRPTWPNVSGSAELATCVAAAEANGAESVAFYNYGHMRLQSLDWIAMSP
ncbi:hypothetical protein [Ostreiculturibacter nitratireducens]|uniref:hypothetical protein n=1 Tax=Ostreiculturibacter nitratireducens TaxID=3075226 RepID=UPI0031B5E036